MLPEKLVFSNNTFQTTKPNEILTLLCSAVKGFSDSGKEKSSKNAAQSYVVTPKVQFSNQLWTDFKRIYELKAIVPVQLLQPMRGELYKRYAV